MCMANLKFSESTLLIVFHASYRRRPTTCLYAWLTHWLNLLELASKRYCRPLHMKSIIYFLNPEPVAFNSLTLGFSILSFF